MQARILCFHKESKLELKQNFKGSMSFEMQAWILRTWCLSKWTIAMIVGNDLFENAWKNFRDPYVLKPIF